jgi:hypothetical protein
LDFGIHHLFPFKTNELERTIKLSNIEPAKLPRARAPPGIHYPLNNSAASSADSLPSESSAKIFARVSSATPPDLVSATS